MPSAPPFLLRRLGSARTSRAVGLGQTPVCVVELQWPKSFAHVFRSYSAGSGDDAWLVTGVGATEALHPVAGVTDPHVRCASPYGGPAAGTFHGHAPTRR